MNNVNYKVNGLTYVNSDNIIQERVDDDIQSLLWDNVRVNVVNNIEDNILHNVWINVKATISNKSFSSEQLLIAYRKLELL